MTHKIDHFAVGTSSLAAGVAALEPTLGVTVPDGSKHTLMSTHNCVMQAGNESFFELNSCLTLNTYQLIQKFTFNEIWSDKNCILNWVLNLLFLGIR